MNKLVLPVFVAASSWKKKIPLIFLLWLSMINLLTHIFHTQSRLCFAVSTAASVVIVAVVLSVRRIGEIDFSQKAATLETSLLGRTIKVKHIDLSGAAWVRARKTSSKLDTVTVEVGTVGYVTTSLISLDGCDEASIGEAEQWCAQIASGLGIPSKGYRPQW